MGVIRIILAVSVVLHHSFGQPIFVEGRCSVMVFFMISGFYMELVIRDKYSALPRWRGKFLLNRFLRLWPTYIFGLLSITLMAWWLGSTNIFTNPEPGIDPATLWLYRILNITVIGQDIMVGIDPAFDGIPVHPISPAWTLASEFTFYFMIALLPVRWLWLRIGLLLAIFAVNYFGQGWLCSITTPGCDRFPFTTVFYFAAGALSYYLYDTVKATRWAFRAGVVALVGSLAIFLAPAFYAPALSLVNYQSPLNPILYCLMFFAIPLIFIVTQHWKWDRIIGDFSYPMYILQMNGIFYGEWLFSGVIGKLLGIAGTQQPPRLLAVFLFSLVAYKFVEMPIEAIRRRIADPTDVRPRSDRRVQSRIDARRRDRPATGKSVGCR